MGSQTPTRIGLMLRLDVPSRGDQLDNLVGTAVTHDQAESWCCQQGTAAKECLAALGRQIMYGSQRGNDRLVDPARMRLTRQ